MAPGQKFRLHSYQDGEAQLRDERLGKAPVFIVIINGGRDDERSLRVRLTRLASENVTDQHIVLVANHSWIPEALAKFSKEFYPKMQLYQLTADGGIEVKPRNPLAPLLAALKAQEHTPPLTLTEAEFAARCETAEAEKQRLIERYNDSLLQRGAPFTLGLAVLLVGLYGLSRLWQSHSDNATVLVQLGAGLGPFIRDGDWWRLLSSSLLQPGLLHLGLAVLLLLSLGYQAEKLLGTAQLVTLFTLSALAAGLRMFAPGSAALGLSVGTGGALWGILAALAVLALRPTGLPIAVGERLRKIVWANLIIGVVLSLLPSVDRLGHVAGAVIGALLAASGVLQPLRIGDAPKMTPRWIGQGILGTVCGLLLVGALTTALLVGKPWQPDPSWKQRLATIKGLAKPGAMVSVQAVGTGSTPPGETPAGSQPAELMPVRRTLGEAGYSIALPQGLGEPRPLTDAGKIPVFQFGDLNDQQQALDVVVQRQQRPLKKKAQLQQAFEQSVALVRADKLKNEAKELTPAARFTQDAQLLWTFHARLQESVQGKAVVLARRDAVIVLWYVYSDLLTESQQLDLPFAAKSVRDEFAGATSGPKKKAKRRR